MFKILSIIIGFIFMIALSSSAYALSLNAEEKMQPLPPKIEQALRAFIASGQSSYSLGDCTLSGEPFKLSGHPSRDAYFIGTGGCGGGSSVMPVWIVDTSGSMPKVLLSDGAVDITQASQSHNGLNDLRLITGNAGHAGVTYYIFNGSTYEPDEKRSWTFFGDCDNENEVKNPENPFDMSKCGKD